APEIPPTVASPGSMHVSQLLYPLLRRPHIEIIEAGLPERATVSLISEQVALPGVASFAFG
ncbi:MAG TPA: hypothetical protein VI386_11065, partial [Candidatus Sulfotelmatobacter sp.]